MMKRVYQLGLFNNFQFKIFANFFLVFAASISSAASSGPSFIKILAAGDTQLGNDYIGELPRENPIRPLFSVIRSADLAMVNYEGTLCDQKVQSYKCAASRSCWAFKVPTSSAGYLKEAGFHIVNLANNHMFDFGPSCASETKAAVESQGMLPVGLKSNPRDAIEEIGRIIEFRGRRIAILGFHFNNTMERLVSLRDDASVAKVIRSFKEKADIVVVQAHSGAEGPEVANTPYSDEVFMGANRGNVRRFSKLAVDSGADLVISHGPHVMRGMELYKDRLILYSIGNFATYSQFSFVGLMGLSALVTVDLEVTGEFVSGQIHSLYQFYDRNRIPTIAYDPQQRTTQEMQRLTAEDFKGTPLTITNNGQILRK